MVFNKEGRCIGSMGYKKGSTDPIDYNEFEYSEGNLVKSLSYNSPLKKVLLDKIEYDYDHKNREVITKFFGSSYCESNTLWLTSKSVLEYNEYDDVIKAIDSSFVYYDCDDIRIRTTIYERHPIYQNGLKVEDDTYAYEYDQDGNMIKKIDKSNPPIYYEYYPNGFKKKEYLAEDSYDDYNEDGYLIRATSPVRGGFMYTIVYENEDKYGNWTRRVIYRDKEPYLLGERTIIYYD